MRSFAVRKWQIGAVTFALLATVATGPLALRLIASKGYDLSGLHPTERLMALLDARSPGERETGTLALTKMAKRAAQPTEHALGKIVHPKLTPTPEFVRVITAPPSAVTTGLATAPVTLAEIVPPVLAPPPTGGVGIPTIVPGGGGPGSPTSVTSNAPDVVPTPPPAVPEPDTWLMMVLGFGVIGWSVRRRNCAFHQSVRTA